MYIQKHFAIERWVRSGLNRSSITPNKIVSILNRPKVEISRLIVGYSHIIGDNRTKSKVHHRFNHLQLLLWNICITRYYLSQNIHLVRITKRKRLDSSIEILKISLDLSSNGQYPPWSGFIMAISILTLLRATIQPIPRRRFANLTFGRKYFQNFENILKKYLM